MAVHRGVVEKKKNNTGLSNLTTVTLARALPKPKNIRFSQIWEGSRNLPIPAVEYAVCDAEAGLQLYLAYRSLPDLTARLKSDKMQCHKLVDIMPSASIAKKPIAQGIICQIDGKIFAFEMRLSQQRSTLCG
jgi:hypothetical protein